MEYRILIVDEDPAARKHYADALIATPPPAGPSYSVAVVGSTAAAQLRAARQSYHVLLATLHQSNDVLDLTATLRERYPQLIVVLAVDKGVALSRRRAAEALGVQLVQGPLNTDEISQLVARVLGLTSPRAQAVTNERPPATLKDVQMLLDMLRRQASAQIALYTDNLGNMIAERGDPVGLDIAALTSLIAGGFVNAVELGHVLRDPGTIHLSVHEGSLYDIYSASVGANRLVALAFDKQIVTPRLGMIWLLMKRASLQLQRMHIVEQGNDDLSSQQLSASLSNEFDRLFGDELLNTA
jgi:CheY-like chemotaxis protein